jgi:hypothetical protein
LGLRRCLTWPFLSPFLSTLLPPFLSTGLRPTLRSLRLDFAGLRLGALRSGRWRPRWGWRWLRGSRRYRLYLLTWPLIARSILTGPAKREPPRLALTKRAPTTGLNNNLGALRALTGRAFNIKIVIEVDISSDRRPTLRHRRCHRRCSRWGRRSGRLHWRRRRLSFYRRDLIDRIEIVTEWIVLKVGRSRGSRA